MTVKQSGLTLAGNDTITSGDAGHIGGNSPDSLPDERRPHRPAPPTDSTP
jgi:hypothetical protein